MSQSWSALEALAGKRLLLTGSTGFIGKVTLSMLLERVREVGPVTLVVRPKPGLDAFSRFNEAIESSPVFAPVRDAHGGEWLQWVRSRVAVLSGDTTAPRFGLPEEKLDWLRGRIDAMIHLAGLVSFNPPLDGALRNNAVGALAAAQVARRIGAKLIHVSTCYVAGLKGGLVEEELPHPAFDPEEELLACGRAVQAIRERAAARRLQSRWIQAELAEEGRRRSRERGFPNTYCYTKALGEALIAAEPGLDYAIVRPSIVESALRFPFPGWNEGLNTSARVILTMCQGHVLWPAHRSASLDVVPVDMVAAGLLTVTAAALEGNPRRVYNLGSSDTNPMAVRQSIRFVSEYRSRNWRDHAPGRPWVHWLRTRIPIVTVPNAVYRAFGLPAYRRLVQGLVRPLAVVAPAGRPRTLARFARSLEQAEHVVETFRPFVHDGEWVFRTDAIRELYAGLPDRDRELLPWEPEAIEWRSYWLDVHTEGLRQWVFPGFGIHRSKAGVPARRIAANRAVRRVLGAAQRAVYTWGFRSLALGTENIPPGGPFIVAANHSSHLDMGLIKHALGLVGEGLATVAAKDYFFNTPFKRFFFGNFTNLIPIDRRAGLKGTMQAASGTLQRGRNLLIFPEGTRSTTGRIASFKAILGYMALRNRTPVLPVFVSGTFQALPKGSLIPRRRRIAVRFGPLIPYEELARRAEGLAHSDACRAATAVIEEAVRRLAVGAEDVPSKIPPPHPPEVDTPAPQPALRLGR